MLFDTFLVITKKVSRPLSFFERSDAGKATFRGSVAAVYALRGRQQPPTRMGKAASGLNGQTFKQGAECSGQGGISVSGGI